MKHILFLSFWFFSFSYHSHCQESELKAVALDVVTYKYLVKAYNTVSYSRKSATTLWPNYYVKSQARQEDYAFLHPSIAFAWSTRRSNMAEVELTSFRFGRSKDVVYAYDSAGNLQGAASGATFSSADIALRIERVVNFDKRHRMRCRPMLGFALSPYYTLDKVAPYTTAMLPSTVQHFGVRGYIIPRINYSITKRLVLDVNIPVLVADLDIHVNRAFNPALGKEARTSIGDFNVFPRSFSARLGLGMRL